MSQEQNEPVVASEAPAPSNPDIDPEAAQRVTSNKDLIKYLIDEKIGYKKMKEMPWGSYQIALSLDSISWLAFNRFFGWGWLPEESITCILTDELKGVTLNTNLVAFLGQTRVSKIKEILSI